MQSKARANDDAGPVLAAVLIVLGLAGYGWWKLGESGRRAWLSAIQHAEGYGPVPADMLGQLEWLATNRLHGMEGMAALLMLAALAGLIEGNARRETVLLSGFGLRPLKTGRVLGLLWTGGLVLYFIAPVPLPYVGVSVLLTALLGAASYKLARGLRRVH